MGIRGGGRVFDIGELGGILKLLAWEQGVNLLIVPPSTLKQFITGKGNATKPEMSQALATKYNYDVVQNDECDALCLLLMGDAYLRQLSCIEVYIEKCLYLAGRS